MIQRSPCNWWARMDRVLHIVKGRYVEAQHIMCAVAHSCSAGCSCSSVPHIPQSSLKHTACTVACH